MEHGALGHPSERSNRVDRFMRGLQDVVALAPDETAPSAFGRSGISGTLSPSDSE